MFTSTLFVIVLLTVAQSKSLAKMQSTIIEEAPKLKIKQSKFIFNLDDAVISIFANDNELKFFYSPSDAESWRQTKIHQMYLYAGDIIRVKGKDTLGNVAGLVGTLTFYDKYGVEKIYNTGEGWFCSNKPAILLEPNNGQNPNWPHMPGIQEKAYWIWDTKTMETQKEVSCTFKIPC